MVDLSRVTFIASLGISMLISTAKALERHGVKMVLLGPPDLVQRTLEAAGVQHVIPIASEEERALLLLG
jgi:anti-anti-sigma factor